MTHQEASQNLRAFALTCALALCLSTAIAQSTMVRLHTNQGPIDVELYDVGAPLTVANFLGYVRRGDYKDTLIHRSVAGFVIQMGGYAWPASGYAGRIKTQPPVVNEFSASRSNLRGTVAMAKIGGDPNSATSEWFVNLADNSANLDRLSSNGGYTVFGRVTTPSMAVVDRIAALPRVDVSASVSAFTHLPVVGTVGSTLLREHVVLTSEITEFPAKAQSSTSGRIFDYLEAAYPQYVKPARGEAGTALGYVYRYYAESNAYVGTKDGQVWYLVPALSPDIGLLGDMQAWLAQAVQAGY